MKVLFLHDHKTHVYNNALYSSGGLSQNIFNRYISYLNADSITLATREVQVDHTKGLSLISGEKIKLLPIPDLASLNPLHFWQAFKILLELIKQNDVIIIRLPSLIGSMGAFIAKKLKKRVIIEMVGCPWDGLWNYGNWKGKILAPIQMLITKFLVKRANNVIYVSAEFLQSRYPSSGKNTLGCSDVEIELDIHNLKKRIHQLKMTPKKTIKLGMIGALGSKYKGFDLSLKALEILNNKVKGTHFILEIVGGGSREDIMDMARKMNLEDHLSVKGKLPHPHGINEWLDTVDIYLQPSRVEALPRALVEAMNRGCACIGSDVGGIPELLDSQYRIKKNDYRRLAGLIEYLAENALARIEQINTSSEKLVSFQKNFLDKKRADFYTKSLL